MEITEYWYLELHKNYTNVNFMLFPSPSPTTHEAIYQPCVFQNTKNTFDTV